MHPLRIQCGSFFFDYVMKIQKRSNLPRLPLDGSLDLTYRCNNNCLHCWLWLSNSAPQRHEELSFDEICKLVKDARSMGCQAWTISGGEPMLRPDFSEILNFITLKSVTYKLNTNGTLITPQIAQLLKRKGEKMVALYGATANVHDRVTRNPGSFEATMRGFSYLKEAGAHFTVQLVPMQANYFQYTRMLELAESLTPHYRVGAPWLWLSSSHCHSRNIQIRRQRLDPAEALKLDDTSHSSELAYESDHQILGNEYISKEKPASDDYLFAACIDSRRNFHIDPYGQISFCYYIKDPELRYDLRNGTFQQAWDEFIPSLREKVRGGEEYRKNCGSCDLRSDCRWCAVYGYLEHGRYSAKVEYLCEVAKETRRSKQEQKMSGTHYYQIAGITLKITADFELADDTFPPAYSKFRVNGSGTDNAAIHHIPSIPDLGSLNLGRRIYRHPPWEIYEQTRALTYVGISSESENKEPRCIAIFSHDHNHCTVFNKINVNEKVRLNSLYTFPTDQIVLAQLLVERKALLVHAAGCVLDGKGLLFVGHSEAGKSTILKQLRGKGEILCDDRIIIRSWPDDIRIHGTWSHGELPDVSPSDAPLKAIFYLEKATTNQITAIDSRKDQLGNLLSHTIRPLTTANWWEKTIDLVNKITAEVPAYRLQFDLSGEIVKILQTI